MLRVELCACVAHMNLLNLVCRFRAPWEGRGKIKCGEKSGQEEIKNF